MSRTVDRTIQASASGAVTEELIVVNAPQSAAAEAYRSLRSNIKFAQSERPIRSVLIADAGTAGQHPAVAANLAAALALGGDTAILVDADLRRPALHVLLGATQTPGLVEHILAPDLAATPQFQATTVANLRILPAGDTSRLSGAVTPADLITSDQCGLVLERLRGDCEFIVVNAPPLTECADALGLAAHVDGVILLIRARKTRRQDAQRAKEQLDRVGAHILGVVLTDSPSR